MIAKQLIGVPLTGTAGTSFATTLARRRNDRAFRNREFRRPRVSAASSVADSLGIPNFMSEGKFASNPSPKPIRERY